MNGRKRELQLSAQEHEILRAIASSPSSPPPLSSMQRLRFEMLGLIEDRAKGVRLTERGREVAHGPFRAAPRRQPPRISIVGRHATKEAGASATSDRALFRATRRRTLRCRLRILSNVVAYGCRLLSRAGIMFIDNDALSVAAPAPSPGRQSARRSPPTSGGVRAETPFRASKGHERITGRATRTGARLFHCTIERADQAVAVGETGAGIAEIGTSSGGAVPIPIAR